MSTAESCYCPQARLLSRWSSRGAPNPYTRISASTDVRPVQLDFSIFGREAPRTIFSTVISLCCFLNFFKFWFGMYFSGPKSVPTPGI